MTVFSDYPCVTVVTPSYNQGQFIGETIESVLSQDYPSLEYIIMDGGSTDNTLEVIRQYEHDPRLTWYSEPDRGMSHALNKAFSCSTGDILTWLNSDDIYIGQVIRPSVEIFICQPTVDFVYGDVIFTDIHNRPTGYKLPGKQPFSSVNMLSDVVSVAQPGTFWRRSVWEKTGILNESLDYAMDIEFFLRAAQHATMLYIPGVRATYRQHEASKTVQRNLQGALERVKLAEIWMKQYPELEAQRTLIEANFAFMLAEIYQRQHDLSTARRYIRRALRNYPVWRRRWLLILLFGIDLHFHTKFVPILRAVLKQKQ